MPRLTFNVMSPSKASTTRSALGKGPVTDTIGASKCMAKTFCAASVIALLCGGVSTPAHHSVAVNFDSSQVLTLTGRITDLDFRNPHSQITLQVTQRDGTVKEWFIEWSDRNALVRRKVPFQLLRVGDTVTISASPSRRLDNLAYFRTAVLPDKSVLRDCGFDAFRQAIAKGQFIECEPGRPSETSPPQGQQREQR